jgi:shikimate kinase
MVENLSSRQHNIALIGMPGVGKSTLGPVLAAQTGREFVDTDQRIVELAGLPLQDIVNQQGVAAMRDYEERVLLDLQLEHAVIATGGSVIYSQRGMANLAAQAFLIYCEADLPTLESRLNNFAGRGIVRQPGQTLADLYAERTPLYQHYANATVNVLGKSVDEICAEILRL